MTQKTSIGEAEGTSLSLRPEYQAKLDEEAADKLHGKKKKDDKKTTAKEQDDLHNLSKKKKGSKNNKKDPADQFDPLNFKPSLKGTNSDISDLKSQLAHFEFKCSACPFGSNLQEEFKSHFKCEWHKINTQRKVAEQDPLTEEQFKELVLLKEFAK